MIDRLDEVTITRLGYAYCGDCRERGCGDERPTCGQPRYPTGCRTAGCAHHGDAPDARPEPQLASVCVAIGEPCDGCSRPFREATPRRRAVLELGITDLEKLDRIFGREREDSAHSSEPKK